MKDTVLLGKLKYFASALLILLSVSSWAQATNDSGSLYKGMYAYRKTQNQEESMKAAAMFLTQLDTIIYNPAIAEIARELTEYHCRKFQFSESIHWGEYALNIYEKCGDIQHRAEIQLLLAKLYLKKSKPHMTLLSLHECMKVFRELKDTLKYLESLNISGRLKIENRDIEGARKDFNSYTNGARYFQDTMMIAKGLNNMAILELGEKDRSLEKAKKYFRKAISLAEKTKDSSLYFKTNISLISTQINSDSLEQAAECLSRIKDMARDIEEEGTYYWMEGWYLSMARENERAIESLEKAVHIFSRGEFDLPSLSCYYLLAGIYHQIGNDLKAYEALDLYLRKNSQNYNRDELIKLFSLQNSIIIDKEMLSLKENKLKQRNIFIMSLFIFLIIVILLIGFYVRKKLKLEQKEAILATMELEKKEKEQELKSKNEIVEIKRMQQFQAERLTMSIIEKLNKLNNQIKEKSVRDEISMICYDLKNSNEDTDWEEIKQFIPEFNSSFFQRLSEDYPDLSINQKRLCILLNMNMTTKMIAQITKQSPHSINISRSRLRKKFNLSSKETSIQEFLSKYNKD